MSYTRECLNGISKVLFITAISAYALSYVLETPKGKEIYNNINNFISEIADSTSKDSIPDRVFTPKPVPLEEIE